MIRILRSILVTGLALVPLQSEAQSSNPFSPVIIVNERPITHFELEQRRRILSLFRATGDIDERARNDLIDDRLRTDAANRLGITIAPEQTEEGMAEFAQRTNMDTETFLSSLAANGVDMQTFRDFVNAGVLWREVVRTRFGPRAQITDAEIDRALALTSQSGGAEATLAEIILPARTPEELATSEQIANDIYQNATSIGGFAAAARQYSASRTRENGGRLPRAMPLSEMPPAIRGEILTLAPGGVTTPINVPNAIALFQLIELRETGVAEAQDVTLEYATYLIPGGLTEAALAEAARVAASTDTCDDLHGINLGQPPERLTFETLPASEVPRDIALELAKLDPGETSAALIRGGNLAMLMLCARTPVFEEQPDRERVRNQLINQRLAAYGDGYLAELRADAIILYP
ncbi:peptidylprolyl isomerase [Tropicimonas aquimaris]|uniref:Parvulin-like PPIase n=1 Tax=Tropicimonas aquimaris TaxID=914152 RepID=A0ABW3IPV1_9RHOB